jgi:hypothetical protein
MKLIPHALWLMATLAACDARTLVRGRVVDADGKPIAGVRVVLHPDTTKVSDREQVTAANGCFSLGANHGAGVDFELLASREGYKALRTQLVAKHQSSIELALTLATSAADSHAKSLDAGGITGCE